MSAKGRPEREFASQREARVAFVGRVARRAMQARARTTVR